MAERLVQGTKIASCVNLGEEIQYEVGVHEHYLVFRNCGISFKFDESSRFVEITNLYSHQKDQGKRMVAEMVGILGTGVDVFAGVINKKTIDELIGLGYGRAVVTVTNRPILLQLKIVKVLEDGGITVDKIRVGPPTQDELEVDIKLDTYLFGHF